MKNNRLTFIILLILCILSSCDRNEIETDYRNSLIGDYQCSYALKTLTLFNSQSMERFVDTLFYSIDTVIRIEKSEYNNEISFLDWNLVVNSDGEIDSVYCINDKCMDCDYLPIELVSNNLNFELTCGNIKTTWYSYKVVGVKI